MPVRGLTIVLGEAAPPRLRTALVLLLAQAALGGRAQLFLEGPAVALLADALAAETALLRDEALAGGIAVTVCQTGLADAGLSAADLDARLGYGGPVSLLADLGDDRLLLG